MSQLSCVFFFKYIQKLECYIRWPEVILGILSRMPFEVLIMWTSSDRSRTNSTYNEEGKVIWNTAFSVNSIYTFTNVCEVHPSDDTSKEDLKIETWRQTVINS